MTRGSTMRASFLLIGLCLFLSACAAEPDYGPPPYYGYGYGDPVYGFGYDGGWHHGRDRGHGLHAHMAHGGFGHGFGGHPGFAGHGGGGHSGGGGHR
jgi:hypothetical protein